MTGDAVNDATAMFPTHRLCACVSAVMIACLAGLLPATGAAGADDGASVAEAPRVGFVDVSEAVGLNYAVETGGGEDSAEPIKGNLEDGGLALSDIDGDGRPELYVAHGNRRNRPALQLERPPFRTEGRK